MKNQEVRNAQMSQNIGENEFLQSQEWLKFQEAFGRRTFSVEAENFSAKIIEHVLPVVGRYFYVPRGPVMCHPERSDDAIVSSEVEGSRSRNVASSTSPITASLGMTELLRLAREEHAGWIRIEPNNSRLLDLISANLRVVKAPYDVQPKEIFKIDITKSEEQLLAEMKSKTRYNIGIARKRGVSLRITNGYECTNNACIENFLELTKEMAARQGIVPHPEGYYRKMFETFPKDMLSLYVAEYDGPASTREGDCSPASTRSNRGESTRGGKIIAANLVLFYGDTATYLHGASSNEHRNVMAPFLLQWQAILDAKKKDYKWYDFGGVSTNYEYGTNVRITNKKSSWSGITDFKRGFSPNTEPIVFPGTYDIIVNPRQYALYKGLQKAKMILKKFRR